MTYERGLEILFVPYQKRYRQPLEVPYILLGLLKLTPIVPWRTIEMMTFLINYICPHFIESNIFS